jgi:hypothetical protein
MKSISEALVKFQTQMKAVAKDSENPFFKSSYADLSSILQTVVPVLSSCGIAVIQPMKIDGDKTILVTKLIHSSGETLESEMILPHHADPQKYGSLITYYKRYQLQAMLGVSTTEDDNDGNNLAQAKAPPVNQSTKSFKSDTGEATDSQKRAIFAISKSKNIPEPKIDSFKAASEWINAQNNKGK